jgi:hypothetical protein
VNNRGHSCNGWRGFDFHRHSHIARGSTTPYREAAAGRDRATGDESSCHAAGESLRCQAHVHVARVVSVGGNMWKYIAITIGMNTTVL